MGLHLSFAAAPPCSFPKRRSHILPFKWNRQTWVSVHCDSLQPPNCRGKCCPSLMKARHPCFQLNLGSYG